MARRLFSPPIGPILPAMIPTSTNVSIDVKDSLPINSDLAVFVTEGGGLCGDGERVLEAASLKSIKRLLKAGVMRGKSREIVFDLIDDSQAKTHRLYLVGVGKSDKLDQESFRQAGGLLARAVKKHRLSRIAIIAPVSGPSSEWGTPAVVTGFLLANFDYDEYRGTASRKKEKEDSSPNSIKLTVVVPASALQKVRTQVDRARIVADSQNFARTIAHRPGNDINPPTLAAVAQSLAKEVGLKSRVLDEKQMKKLGMGGILAVGSGSSATPPRMIVLEWQGQVVRAKGRGRSLAPRRSPLAPLLIVGKAITFDTGGISIKSAEKMGKMVFDKCGAMAVMGAMCAIARLKLPVHVVGILSSAENHISERAYRPGDLLRMYNGVTVEVTNTDAEGRLVLGDALSWGIEQYKPAAVIDLATLTGGCVVALGRTMAGVMSNDDKLVDELNGICRQTGEKIWRLPIGPDQRDQIKSDDADIVNSAGREASPLQGGAFLSYFIPEDGSVPWAHLDIAGVSDTDKELPYYKRGAVGWGVRTLVEWVAGRI